MHLSTTKIVLASLGAFALVGAGLFWYERYGSPVAKALSEGGNATSLAALDPGLDSVTLKAVHAALTKESDPRVLVTFAQKLLAAGYTMSAAVVTARAQVLAPSASSVSLAHAAGWG